MDDDASGEAVARSVPPLEVQRVLSEAAIAVEGAGGEAAALIVVDPHVLGTREWP